MKHAIGCRAAAILLSIGSLAPGLALAQQDQPSESTQIRDRDWEARCLMTSRIFYRLAEQRSGGADARTAVFSVSQWASKAGDIGSHHRIDYGESVASAGKFVYAHPELNKAALAHFGYRSCALHYVFKEDPLKVEASQMLLLQAAAACQAEHPGDRHNRPLRECMTARAGAIEARVRKAQIQVRG